MLVATDEIPAMIDAKFSLFVNPCNDILIRHSGLVTELYSQEQKRDVIYVPDSLVFGAGLQWMPDDSYRFQTAHLLRDGFKDSSQRIGTFEEGDFSLRCTYAVLHFGQSLHYLETLRAVESVEGVSVISLDLKTMNVLRSIFKLKTDEDYNLPPYVSAWSITYEIKNVTLYGA